MLSTKISYCHQYVKPRQKLVLNNSMTSLDVNQPSSNMLDLSPYPLSKSALTTESPINGDSENSFPFLLSFTADQQNRKWLLWCYNDYVIIIVRIIKCFNDYFLMYDNSKVIGFIFALKTISNYFFQDFVLAIFENDNVHSQIIMIVIIIISVTGEFFLFLHVRYFSSRWLFL